ncbi:DUF2937 family protein [Rhodospira trueperi]|uniref:DUF2937 family protein n=1 Tax=Rhodospira trueperi TaxID=69960 RepID=A0A1G7AVZ9_9PROT|nr:DUF2937 family protein [Rhodospira trueperi]SDE18757.1 Protein of unknown function [Rhodospira trueperi]
MPAGWALRKLDSLGGAAVAAVGGGAASQWRAFLHQYLQRLGGHADEAVRNLDHLTELHDLAGPAEQPVLASMMSQGSARVEDLREALRVLTDAGPVMQPVAFLRHLDPAIARATLDGFQPALPLDTASLLWAGAGLVLTLVLYELVKGVLWAPVAVVKGMARKPRGRRRPGGDRAPRERIEPSL